MHMPIRIGSQSTRLLLAAALIVFALLCASGVHAHDGPDPIGRWRADASSVTIDAHGQLTIAARLGPDGVSVSKPLAAGESSGAKLLPGRGLFMPGDEFGICLAEDHNEAVEQLPIESITVAAWVTIDRPETWGGILGAVRDNGTDESGWVLGYDQHTFSFALRGQDGGDNRLTYLKGTTRYEPGKFYHVVGVYDGQLMQLFVNGKLDSSSEQEAGKIVYPKTTPLMLGGYRDDNEFQGLRGIIPEISLYDQAAKPAWVAHQYEHQSELADLPVSYEHLELESVIDPYLQFGTQTEMTVIGPSTFSPASKR